MWILDILVLNLAIVFFVEISFGFLCGVKTSKSIISIALINIITNPAVVLCMLTVAMFFNKLEYIVLAFLEIGVVTLEGFLYSKFGTFPGKSPYLISMFLNVFSFLAGCLIKPFI